MGKAVLFTAEVREALQRHWTGPDHAYDTREALSAEGFELSLSQIINGAGRYCRETPPPPVMMPITVSIVNFGFAPGPKPDNVTRIVPPGTYKAPVGGFSMIRAK